MFREMDSAELTEWQALYLHIEPLPEDRADLRMGITVANGLAPHLKKGKTACAADFMPNFSGKPRKPKQSIEQMKAIWGSIAGKWNRKK
jgi:hypothetical protein